MPVTVKPLAESAQDVSVVGRLDRAREVIATLRRRGVHPGTDADRDEMAERVRGALVELGTTAVKLGQFLAQRPDLAGAEVADALSSLHDDVPAEPTEDAFATFEETVGAPPSEHFAHIDETPMAAGSIGQVHRARLNDGRDVVVKIRRRHIVTETAADMAVLNDLVTVSELGSWLPHLDLRSIVHRFRETLEAELDFRIEAANLERFREAFDEDPRLAVPEPIPAASSQAVLTMTHLDGVPFADPDALHATTDDPEMLVELGVGIVLDMIVHGTFHADPHPGNLLLIGPETIGLVDFGMVGWLSPGRRQAILAGVRAFRDDHAGGLVTTLLHLTHGPPPSRESLIHDVRTLLHKHRRVSMADVDVTELLQDLVELLRSHDRVLRGPVALLLRCMVMLDGTARSLTPDYDLAGAIERWSDARRRDALGPVADAVRDWLPDLGPVWPEGLGALNELPDDVQDLLHRANRGTLTLQVRPIGLDSAVHRLTTATVIAALMLGGSVLLGARVPPVVWDVSLAGLAVLLLGGILAIPTFLSMLWTPFQK